MTQYDNIRFRGLLHKEPGFRLGCRRVGKAEEGAEELKAHPFFCQADHANGREPVPWKKMEAGKVAISSYPWLPTSSILSAAVAALSARSPCCLCEGRARYRAVQHCEGGASRCGRQSVLWEVQHRIRVDTMAERGITIHHHL